MAIDHFSDFGFVVGWNTTHVVVDSWNDWSWLFGDINTGKDFGSFSNTWKSFVQNLRIQVIKMQVNVILLRSHTSSFDNFHGHGSADDIS